MLERGYSWCITAENKSPRIVYLLVNPLLHRLFLDHDIIFYI